MFQKKLYLKKLTISQKIVLQQLNYWLSKNDSRYGLFREGKQWIRNSYAAWQKQIGSFSVITIRRAFTELEKLGLIKSKTFEEGKKFCGGQQVKYFTIDFDQLNDLLNCSKPLENKTLSDVNLNSNLIGQGDQNDQPYLSNKTSNLKKYHKKNLNHSKSQSAQQEGNLKLKNFDSEQIQNILSMKQIWNEEIEGKDEYITFEEITVKEQAYLLQALAQYFSNDLNSWKIFCEKITTSCFLMGEKTSFRVNLPWILRFSNLQKVLEGNLYGFGDRTSKPFNFIEKKDVEPFSCDLEMDVKNDGFIEETMIQEALIIRQTILKRVGEGAYSSWFSKARLILSDQKKYVLCVENTFIKNSIKNRFELDLKDIIEDVCLIGEVVHSLCHEHESNTDEVKFNHQEIIMNEDPLSSLLEWPSDSYGHQIPLQTFLIKINLKNDRRMRFSNLMKKTSKQIKRDDNILKAKQKRLIFFEFSPLKYVALKYGLRKQNQQENDSFFNDVIFSYFHMDTGKYQEKF